MAKLGQIQFQKKATPQSVGPEAAVQAYRNRQSVFNATMDVVKGVSDQFVKDEASAATAAHRQVGLDVVKFAEENEFIDRDTLKQLNLEHRVDAKNPDGSDMEMIPRHIYLPTLMEQELENSRTMYGDRISLGRDRKTWMREQSAADSQMVVRALANSQAEAEQFMYKQLHNSRKAAITQGKFALARQIQDSEGYQAVYAREPGLREVHDIELGRAETESRWSLMMMNEDFDVLKEELADPTIESTHTIDERRQWFFAVDSKQQALEREQDELLTERQELLFMESMRDVSKGEMSVEQVHELASGDLLSPSQFTSLLRYAEGRATGPDGAAYRSAVGSAIASKLNTELHLAARGVYPDGISNVKDFQSYMLQQVTSNTESVTPDGGIVAGLDDGQVDNLLERSYELEEVPYSSPQYDRLVTELKRRIMQADDDGKPWLSSPDTAQLMANAVDDLHEYIEREQAEGRMPDYGDWESRRMMGYMNKAARQVYLNLPENVSNFVVESTTPDGTFIIDRQGTIDRITERKQALRANNPNADLSALDRALTDFDEYWRAYGDFAGGTNR